MAKPRLQFEGYGTLTNLRWLRDQVQARLAGKDLFDHPFSWAIRDDPEGDKVVTAHTRLNSRIDADDVWSFIKANLATIQSRLTAGKLSFHVCPHGDAELYDCRTDPSAEYEERSFG